MTKVCSEESWVSLKSSVHKDRVVAGPGADRQTAGNARSDDRDEVVAAAAPTWIDRRHCRSRRQSAKADHVGNLAVDRDGQVALQARTPMVLAMSITAASEVVRVPVVIVRLRPTVTLSTSRFKCGLRQDAVVGKLGRGGAGRHADDQIAADGHRIADGSPTCSQESTPRA